MRPTKSKEPTPRSTLTIKEYGFGGKATKNQGITKEICAKYCLPIREDSGEPSLNKKYVKTLLQ